MTAMTAEPVKFVNTDLPDLIELQGVSQTYDKGGSFVIKDLNLLIEDKPNQGQFVVILGRSGCGKSTLLRYISGLQKPSSGKVLLKGQPLTDNPGVGMVFQQYSSFPWLTVIENIMLPLKIKGVAKKEAFEKAMEMVKVIKLEGHENKYAVSPILSGGQLQRVAIARSLISNPEMILMDEPFGALDAHTRFKMQRTLADVWATLQSTVVFVTHDISEAVFLGDDIYVMSNNPGQIVRSFDVNMPFPRTHETRRDPAFISIVNEIEDLLMEE
jgi:NitT/TauT family transport system ATP-binding protein